VISNLPSGTSPRNSYFLIDFEPCDFCGSNLHDTEDCTDIEDDDIDDGGPFCNCDDEDEVSL
jgi:hypothetical protein